MNPRAVRNIDCISIICGFVCTLIFKRLTRCSLKNNDFILVGWVAVTGSRLAILVTVRPAGTPNCSRVSPSSRWRTLHTNTEMIASPILQQGERGRAVGCGTTFRRSMGEALVGKDFSEDFTFRLLGIFRDCLGRQVEEAVRLDMVGGIQQGAW